MKATGCSSGTMSSCLSLDSFISDRTIIDSAAGQRAGLTWGVSAAPGSLITWSLSVGGRLFTGTGDSLSEFWDGKGAGGKTVWPGSYPADLEVGVSGDSCSAREAGNLSVTVEAQPESCGLQIDVGSSVHVASGNLRHSQTLFEFPPSRFPGEFTLTYNSLSSQNDVLGLGWTHTYNLRLRLNNDGSFTLTREDGSRVSRFF